MNLIFWLCSLFVMHCNAGQQRNKYQSYLELPSVQRFREYLRIDTSKSENLKYAVEFWIRQSKEIGLPYAVYEPAGQPIFVATWEGTDPSLPSIMLNHHMDVIKVDESEWSHPPFDAFMDDNGDIYGRGTQDTKDIGIQYFEAIRRLKKDNITLARTIHFTVMPDEESSGTNGMKAFVKTKEFQSLNIGFALDEGTTTTEDIIYVTYVDKRPWTLQFLIRGLGGHGSTMPEGTAMDNVNKLLNAVMAYRDTQKQIMNSNTTHDVGEYTSVNINIIQGGVAVNQIPSEFNISIDMRLAVDADPEEMQSLVNSWLCEAGNQSKVTFIRRQIKSGITCVDDSNPYWVSMRDALTNMGVKFKASVKLATTDILVLRNMGIPALGFATKVKTIPRLHGKDEYQNVETFVKGIDIFTEVIKNLGNTPPKSVSKKSLRNKEKCYP